MMKFFRKYNKQMMAGLMVLLMVVFIGGSALQGLLTPNVDRVLANSKYGPINESDVRRAKSQTELLEALGRDWTMPLSGGRLEVVDWLLLGREAEAMGFGANVSAVRGASSAPADQLELAAHRLRIKPTSIYQALAEHKAVQDATFAVAAAALPSDAELRTAARDALEKVKVHAVVLPAQAFVDASEQFSDAEMQAHFEKFREKERGDGLSFGYYVPAKLKVQYVEINRDAIIQQITLANPERKAHELYDKTKANNPAFKRNPEELARERAEYDAIEGPKPAEPDPLLTWEEAKPVAIELARKQQADEDAAKLASWMVQYADEPWLESERGKSGYRAAPKSAIDEGFYAQMLEHIPSTLNFAGSVSVKTTEPFAPDAATAVPGLGLARFDPEGGAPRMFASLVLKNEAMVPEVPENAGAAGDTYLSLYQTSRLPVRNAETGNYYVFRVVGLEPAHAPESLDAVREQVLADMRLEKGYERAKKHAETLASSLGGQSLKTATEADSELSKYKAENTSASAGYYEPEPFPRMLRFQAASGRPADGTYAAGSDLGRLPNDVVDSMFELPDSPNKVGVYDLRDRATVLVAEGLSLVRAPEDELKKLKGELETQLAQARGRNAMAAWLDRKQIQARTGFELVNQ